MHAAKVTGVRLLDDPRPTPLSFAQQHLRALSSADPGSDLVQAASAIRWTGSIDTSALDRSANEIVRRHVALRTVFAVVDGRDVQIVTPWLNLVMRVEDVSHMPRENRESEVRQRIRMALTQPFDLETGPLVRTTLYRLQGEEHILLIHMHRLVADQASVGIFLRELTALYAAEIEREPFPLPDLPRQYMDYALWEQSPSRGSRNRESLNYWKDQLDGAPDLLKLPSDRSPVPSGSYAAGSESCALPLSFKTTLSDLSEAEGVDPSVTLLSAFAALLLRYTQQEDLLIGLSVTGRDWPETNDLIGPFANTIPFRVSLSGSPTFRELLRRVQKTSGDAYSHLYAPLDLAVGRNKPQHGPANDRSFQVTFGYREAASELTMPRGVRISPFDLGPPASGPDLALLIHDHPNGLRINVEFDTGLLERSTLQRWIRQYRVLLEGVIANPDDRVASLPLLTEEERRQILLEWNDTAADYPSGKCIHQLFEEQAARTPNAIAVVFEGQHLTYRELNQRATRVARVLRNADVWPEVLVGVCLDRSLEMVVGLLAILKAGGAYVPIDPTYPRERIAFMLEDSNVAVLLTSQSLEAQMPAINATVLCLDVLDHQTFDEEIDTLPALAGPENLAYVIYTSGSTGRPKGVQINHRSVVNFLNSMRKRPGLTQDDVLLSVTTLSFDISALEIYLPLMVGARVVIATRQTAMDPRELMGKIERSGCTVMQATPATWRVLMQAGWTGNSRLKILCGGDAMARELAADLLTRCQTLWNMYGPTETTIWSSVSQIHDAASPVRIGRPIDNTQMYILDANRNPAPVGVPGELYIGGDGLSPGYLNRPALTAERFVPNPFLFGEKVYRTGDSARYLPNGEIECLGRIDNQVKIRGFRLELGEIEAVLMEHPDVHQAVVVARDDSKLGKRLIAYFCPKRRDLHTAGLAAYLRSRLPAQMVPSAFIQLEHIPLTPNGKVDRAALPGLETSQLHRSDVVTPADDVESRLHEIWCNVLGLPSISMQDDFFDIGGHSFLSLPLFSQINAEFKLELPLGTLFHAPTIRTMAEVIKNSADHLVRSPIVTIQRGNRIPLFCVGGVSGEVLLFRRLALELGGNRPVYGLQPFGLPEDCAFRIESMAQYYVQEIRAAGYKPPYCLLGYSFGGLVALEMAQHLRNLGVDVGCLLLIDAAYERGCRQQEKLDERLRRYLFHLNSLFKPGRLTHLRSVLRRQVMGAIYRIRPKSTGKNPDMGKRIQDRQEFAALTYRAMKYDRRAYLFKAEDGLPFLHGGPMLGWDGIFSDLTVHELPGDHGTINTGTGLRMLAERISSCLASVDTNPR